MAFCPEHPKWDQNPKCTPLNETTSILSPFISEPTPGGCEGAKGYGFWADPAEIGEFSDSVCVKTLPNMKEKEAQRRPISLINRPWVVFFLPAFNRTANSVGNFIVHLVMRPGRFHIRSTYKVKVALYFENLLFLAIINLSQVRSRAVKARRASNSRIV